MPPGLNAGVPAAPPSAGEGHVRESFRLPVSEGPGAITLPLSEWSRVAGSNEARPPVELRGDGLHVRGALQPLSQYANTYILAADEDGLLIIDQHVAHERVLFERVMAQRAGDAVRVQRLLVPEVIELSSTEATAAEEYGSALSEFGFEIEPFGGNAWALRTVPEVLGQRSGEGVVRELLDTLSAGTGARAVEVLERDVAASIACHSAVRANQPLSFEVMSRLVADLSACETPMHCPHGRPIMLRMTLAQIEQKIGRH
jgi:DNA mismatch repair protein MutL